MDYPVVDADGHALEPVGMWEQYVEEPYKGQVPLLFTDQFGMDRLYIEGKVYPQPFGNGRGRTEGWNQDREQRYHQRFKGAFDPAERIKDMDRQRIAMAIVFPTQGLMLSSIEDPHLGAALCRAYNNWVADYCSTNRHRMTAVAAIPMQDVEAASQELERAVTKLGLKGAFIRPNPVKGRRLDDPYYDRFYDTAQSLGVPVCTHEGTGHHLPAAGADRFDNFFFTHTISHPFEQMLAVASIVVNGVCQRFPRLKVAFLEAGCGWLPFWLDRFDEHYEKRPQEAPWLRMKPSEYFLRQCVISIEPEEKTLKYAVDYLGEDNIIFASDFSHWDASQDPVQDVLDQPISDSAKRKILSDTAVRLFDLSIPSAVPA